MKAKRKLCLIPTYGSIIYFFIISLRLARVGKRSIKREFCYLIIMALLGSLGMLMTELLFLVLKLKIEENQLIYIIVSVLFIWPLITLPVIKYSEKADRIIKNTKIDDIT